MCEPNCGLIIHTNDPLTYRLLLSRQHICCSSNRFGLCLSLQKILIFSVPQPCVAVCLLFVLSLLIVHAPLMVVYEEKMDRLIFLVFSPVFFSYQPHVGLGNWVIIESDVMNLVITTFAVTYRDFSALLLRSNCSRSLEQNCFHLVCYFIVFRLVTWSPN